MDLQLGRRNWRGVTSGTRHLLVAAWCVVAFLLFLAIAGPMSFSLPGIAIGAVVAVVAYIGGTMLVPPEVTQVDGIDVPSLPDEAKAIMEQGVEQHRSIERAARVVTDPAAHEAIMAYLATDARILRFLSLNPGKAMDADHFINLYQDAAEELAARYARLVASGGTAGASIVAEGFRRLDGAARHEFEKLQADETLNLKSLAAVVDHLAGQDELGERDAAGQGLFDGPGDSDGPNGADDNVTVRRRSA